MVESETRTDHQSVQAPYQAYETAHEPAAARRTRWVVRLVVALAVATLLVFGVRALLGRNNGQTADDVGEQNQLVQQPPQAQAAPMRPEGKPTETPLSGSTTDATVGQPQ